MCHFYEPTNTYIHTTRWGVHSSRFLTLNSSGKWEERWKIRWRLLCRYKVNESHTKGYATNAHMCHIFGACKYQTLGLIHFTHTYIVHVQSITAKILLPNVYSYHERLRWHLYLFYENDVCDIRGEYMSASVLPPIAVILLS